MTNKTSAINNGFMMQGILKQFYALLALSVCLSNVALAGTLTSTVNRNQLSTNETLSLNVTYDSQVDSSRLSLVALEKDFELLGMRPQSNSSISIVNGQRTQTATTTWAITLVPKKQGELLIPSLSIGKDKSKPIRIRVRSAATNDAGETMSAPLQVKVSSNVRSAYPGQQVIVNIELTAERGVSNLNGPELVVNNGEVELLSQQSFQRVDNGLARQVIALKYAVFPKTNGELVVPVMTYTAVSGGQQSIFGPRGKQVVARSKQLKIRIKAAPDNESAPWFPAENVVISSKWSGDPSQLKVGEPITRTVTITAVAQRSNVIPPLAQSDDSDELKTYKDQPQLESKTSERGVISTRVESEAMVASVDGQIVLEEVRLPWFDVGAKRWKEAVLPSETLTAIGAPLSKPFTPQQGNGLTNISAAASESAFDSNLSWKISTAVLAFISMLQFIFLWRARTSTSAARTSNRLRNSGLTERTAWKDLSHALNTQDFSSIRKALIDWGRTVIPNTESVSLDTIKNHFSDSQLNDLLEQLERSLFSNESEVDASALKTRLKSLRSSKPISDKSKGEESLPPLYAESKTRL